MKKLTKLFSLLTVLLTMFGPLGNLRHLVHANDQQPHKTAVVVHKVLMSKNDFDTFALKTDEEKTRNGSELLKEQFAGYFGQSATEISGVTFKVYKKITQENTQAVTGESLGISGDNDKYVPLEGEYGSKTTSESGAEFLLDNGVYIFVEDKVNSPYYNKTVGADAGKELTEAQAVPFRVELPITRPDGQGYFDTRDHKLHIYPKNTENKPTVTKTFKDGSMENKNVTIGEEIEYKISTTIPKGSSYKTLVWEDTMLEGLDFVVNSIAISSTELVSLSKDTHFSQIEQDKRGFVLKASEEGLRVIEEAAKQRDITITITYKGMLNDSAQVETLIPNQVKFHYGNRPRNFNDEKPKPVTPQEDGGKFKVKVSKSWGDSSNDKGAIFDIYEKETGVKVGTITIQVGATEGSITEGIKKDVQYIAVERPVAGYIPTYTTGAAGTILVNNKPSDNPPPLVPDRPKVITYGRRFIKTDDRVATALDVEKLLGAEFVVKNSDGQYLTLKNSNTKEQEQRAYTEAEAAYIASVKAKDGQEETKKATRDAAYEALNMQWVWGNKDGAFKFVSSKDGKFEVKGLKQGVYYLEETKAPEGFALLSTAVEFTVGPNTWIDPAQQTAIDGHTQVKNKKITIPQTGGIGTLVFTVVGLSVMAFAYIAMKKRQAEDA